LAAKCELTVGVSFPLEDESMKDTLIQYYVKFGEEFAAAGFGQCGAPMILLPQSVEIGGVRQVIPGKFAFDCQLSLSEVESALGQIRKGFKGMGPEPDLSVTLHDVDGHNHIRLYPRSDIEFYLSGS
jgi:hypothetical protein